MNETVGVARPVADNIRRKSQTSLHAAKTHRRVRNPFKRRSSDSGGSGSEYDPSDSVPHVARSLDKTLSGTEFTRAILVLLHKLSVPQWRSIPEDLAHVINVRRIFGALTNSIYQITLPEGVDAGSKGVIPRAAPKLLLRLYGAHVEALIDRTHELAMLKRLSRHNIGPLLLGTFTNGRFEQWLDSHTLAREEMRDANLSGSIARRMRELHDGVKLSRSEKHSVPAVWQMIDKWLPRAREIIVQRRRKGTGRLSDTNLPTLAHPKGADLNGWGNNLILGQKWQMFELALGNYKLWMEEQYPPAFLKQNLAFCHNDAQYGNILRIENQAQLNAPDQRHRQLIVIDFEYAAPNPRAYDLANHFCEYMYNYHNNTPFMPIIGDYPTPAERQRFLEAYVQHGRGVQPADKADVISTFEREIRDWRVASHAFWCAWGIVMSEDDPELVAANGEDMEHVVVQEERPLEDGGASASDFDYIAYADQKMRLFWGELASGRFFDDYKDNMEGCNIIQDGEL